MKPMLKSTFLALVSELLTAGRYPELQTSPLTCWGNIRWYDEDGKQQVRQLYSSHDCSSLTASTSRKRFMQWFSEAHIAFDKQRVADAGIEVGSLVWDTRVYEHRTVTAIRDGVLVLDGRVEATMDDVIVPQREEPKAAPKSTNGKMLKTDFYKLVNELRVDGITPTVRWSDVWKMSHIIWTDRDGNEQKRPLYRTTPENAYTMRARYDNWLRDAMTLEPLLTDDLPPDFNPGETIHTRTAQEAIMTPTQAVKHMAYTLAGVIEQSTRPGFDAEEAYADLRTNYNHIKANCPDLAIVVWLRNLICFGYVGHMTFADVNMPKLDRLNYILGTGWLPSSEAGAAIQMSTLFEMDWWGADDITVTSKEGDKTYGTATITDTEGLYQFAFEWEADEGELARSVDLPVLISITAGRFTLPYDVKLTDCDVLEALQEMDSVFGVSADIYNDGFQTETPMTE